MRHAPALSTCLLALLSLPFPSACAGFAKLEPEKVASLSLRSRDRAATICPNDPRAGILAQVFYPGHKVVETWTGEGSKAGKLNLTDLVVTSTPVRIDPVGGAIFPRNQLTWIDQRITIRARLGDRPIAAELTLAPRFDCGGIADYSGEVGSHGGPGSGGSHGEPGAALQVAVGRIDTALNGRLLLVRVVRSASPPDYYAVDARGPAARFRVSAAGGDGGPGGDGSTGSSGSTGSDGMSGSAGGTCQDGGRGGSGGDGGNGGPGGDGGDGGDGGGGGTILVEYAPADAELIRLIDFVVDGGSGGPAGRGGDGGAGGRGGKGGSGGSAGSSTDGSGGHCVTSSGSSGMDGSDGWSGPPGSSGREGRPGASGSVRARPAEPSRLWAAEIEARFPIAIEKPDTETTPARRVERDASTSPVGAGDT